MRVIIIATLATTLCGCATTYQPPIAPPPTTWIGDSGWIAVAGTEQHFEGIRRQGEVLMEQTMRPRRTGTVMAETRTKTAYGKDFIIPKDTKVWAENFTLVHRAGWAGQKEIHRQIDPIEWCAVLPHGPDGKQSSSDTVCLFWESPTQARWMQGYRNGGFGYLPRQYGTTGMTGPVPPIDDSLVDLGAEIKRQVRIARLDAKRLEIESVWSDGSSAQREVDSTTGYWGKTNRIVFEAGDNSALEFIASEDHASVRVRRLPAPLR